MSYRTCQINLHTTSMYFNAEKCLMLPVTVSVFWNELLEGRISITKPMNEECTLKNVSQTTIHNMCDTFSWCLEPCVFSSVVIGCWRRTTLPTNRLTTHTIAHRHIKVADQRPDIAHEEPFEGRGKQEEVYRGCKEEAEKRVNRGGVFPSVSILLSRTHTALAAVTHLVVTLRRAGVSWATTSRSNITGRS